MKNNMAIDFLNNAKVIANDFLAIALWIGIWGVSDMTIEMISDNKRTKLLIYLCIAAVAVILALFVGSIYYK